MVQPFLLKKFVKTAFVQNAVFLLYSGKVQRFGFGVKLAKRSDKCYNRRW